MADTMTASDRGSIIFQEVQFWVTLSQKYNDGEDMRSVFSPIKARYKIVDEIFEKLITDWTEKQQIPQFEDFTDTLHVLKRGYHLKKVVASARQSTDNNAMKDDNTVCLQWMSETPTEEVVKILLDFNCFNFSKQELISWIRRCLDRKKIFPPA